MQYQKDKNGWKKEVYLAQDIRDKIVSKCERNQLAGTFSWDKIEHRQWSFLCSGNFNPHSFGALKNEIWNLELSIDFLIIFHSKEQIWP